MFQKRLIFKSLCFVVIFTFVWSVLPLDFVLAEEGPAPAPAAESAPAESPSTQPASESAPAAEAAPNSDSDPSPVDSAEPADSEEPTDQPTNNGQYKNYTKTALGFNFSMNENFQTDLFTGSSSFSLPIIVPPGRQGLEPKLALSYSSSAKGNGPYGVGWSLSGLGAIERSTKQGPPQYDNNSDIFLFNSPNGAGELAPIGNNEYFSKIESNFTKFAFNSTDNSWLATDKNGVKYYFGLVADTRQEIESAVESGGSVVKTFQWNLDKIIDLNGNYLTITYFKDKNQVYPRTISYTGFNNEPALNGLVELVFEDRLDPSLDYRPTFLVETTKRLKEVIVKTGAGQLVSRYGWQYNQSPLTLRAQLVSATLTQYDNTGNSMSWPALTFTYSDKGSAFERTSNFKLPQSFVENGGRGTDTGLRLADLNGDGLTDAIYGHDNQPPRAWLNDGTGFVSTDQFVLPRNFVSDYNGQENGLRLAEVNGDGLVDLVYRNHGNATGAIWLNDGSQFVIATPDFYPPVSFTGNNNIDNGVRLADVNGDGLVDVLQAEAQINNGPSPRTWLNTGSSFVATNNFLAPVWFTNFGIDQGARLADVNNDGLVDVLYGNGQSGSTSQIYLNNGTNFVYTADFVLPVAFGTGGGNDNGVRLADINGDGLVDILMGKERRSSDPEYRAWLNTGSSFVSTPNFQMPIWFTNDYNQTDNGVRLDDIDGDGLIDVLYNNGDSSSNLAWLDNADLPDLLVKIDNGLGGQTNIEYAPSTKFSNKGQDDLSDLGFPIYTVSSFTQADGQGNQYTHTYQYQDGLYNWSQKELRGFGYVKEIDPEQNYVEHYFKQDDIFKGKEYLTLTKDQNGALFNKTENTWQSSQPYPKVNFVYLSQTDNYLYDGDATFKQTRTNYEYDNYGNNTKVVNSGDLNQPGDEKTTLNSYTYNTGNWLMACQRHTALYDSANQKTAWAAFYYDNSDNFDNLPAKCLLTKSKAWLFNPLTNIGSYVVNKYAYDAYGNQITSTDPMNNITTTTYDDQLQTYPIKVTNPLGHSQSFTYDYALGQILTSTDPNNQTTKNTYDALGRLSKVSGPLDTEQYPGEIYEYDLLTKPIKTIKQVKSSYDLVAYPPPANYYSYYTFTDGLGRTIETKSPAKNDPVTNERRQIVSGIVKYDSRGLVKERFHPYFVQDSSDYVMPDYNQPYFSFDYDSMGRLTKTANPNSTFSTLAYNDWQMTATDENNHSQTNHYDAYQRLIKVEEHNQVQSQNQTYTTTYNYDAQDNLIKITDNQNNITQFLYDSLNRKLKMADPDLGIWTYEYDRNGNLIKQTDAKNQTTSFYYDPLNRITKKRYQGVELAVYAYDDISKPYGIGRLFSETYQDENKANGGVTKHYYDQLGRENVTINEIYNTGTYTVSRIFDALNRVLNLTYPDKVTIKYAYSPQGLEQVRQGTDYYISRVDYTATNQISKINYGGTGTTTLYTYDPKTLRLSKILTKNNVTGLKLQDLTYTFDKVGNIQTIVDAINTNSQNFNYDDLDRLINATGSYGTQTYEYDSIGNIIKKDNVVLTYGPTNQQPHAPKTYGSTQMAYDANGNLTSKGTKQFTYNGENKLTKAQENGQATNFTYDNQGQRVKKIVGANATTYVNNLYEIDSNGTTRKHLFNNTTRFLTINKSGGTTPTTAYGYYHSDHLGSSNVITDQTGAQVSLTEYVPYGATSKQVGTYDPEFKFNAKELDATTNLYYYGARYYDVETGRFTQADTIVPNPGDPQSLNRYAYTLNNPLKYEDPNGNIPVLAAAILGGAAISAGIYTATSLYSGDFSWKGLGVSAVAGGAAGLATSIALMTAPAVLASGVAGAITSGVAGGATYGAVSSSLNGDFSASQTMTGAVIGGATAGVGHGVMKSLVPRVTNLAQGYGFKSNYVVQQGFEEAGDFQGAIDFSAKRYGYVPGRWTPKGMKANVLGDTDINTGEIRIGPLSFSRKSELQCTGCHENIHAGDVNSGMVKWDAAGKMTNGYYLEVRAGLQTLANAWRLDLTKDVIKGESKYLMENLKGFWKGL